MTFTGYRVGSESAARWWGSADDTASRTSSSTQLGQFGCM